MGLLDLEPVEYTPDVLGRTLLRVRLDVVGHVRGRIAARVERDRAVPAREEARLQMPAAVVAGELVDEDQRQALARFLVVDVDAVVDSYGGHDARLSRSRGNSLGRCRSSSCRPAAARSPDRRRSCR